VTAAAERPLVVGDQEGGADRPAARSRRGRAADVAPFLPAGAVVALWLLFARRDGGYSPTTWYPAAIGLCGLLAVVAPRHPPLSRALWVAFGLLGSLVAWSFASMLWADSPATAWETSNQLVLLALGAAVMALTPWTPRSAALLLGVWAVGIGVVCALTLLEALRAGDLTSWFDVYRWAQPTGYPNGAAGLAALAFWPALLLSSRRQTPAAFRIALLPLATFLLLFSLLPQSRGSAIGLVLVMPLLLFLASQRLRLMARVVLAGIAVLVTADPIFRVYETVASGGRATGVLADAARAIGLATAGALAAAVGLLVIERAAAGRPRWLKALRRATVGIAVAAVVAVGVAAALNFHAISSGVGERWDTLRSGRETHLPTGPRLGADIGDQRTDFWRVALDLFEEAPVTGAGAGNFEQRYTTARRRPNQSRYPHDVWLRFLGETGAVGLMLFLGLLGTVLGVPIARRRSVDRSSRGIVAVCVAMTAYFLVHASVDWLDRMPAVAGPAFAVPFVALRLVSARAEPRKQARAWRWVGVGATLLGSMVLAASLIPPWIAARQQERAVATWRSDPAGALADLDHAADANPLSALPLLSKGTIAIQLGRAGVARAAFRDAIRREDNWLPHFQLALLDADAGRFRAAGREIRRAAELSASDSFVSSAAADIEQHRRLDPIALNRELLKLTIYRQEKLA
jgi:hypothetical protein